MGENLDNVAALERRIEYLSAQVERLVELQSSFPSPMTIFRKAAMLAALTFEQEALARKLLGAVHAFNNGEKVDINQGLLPFPKETVDLFNECADKEEIDSEEVKGMLKTFVPGGDGAAQSLLEAWEIVQSKLQRSDGELH
ncbi:hypothetical protein OS128_08670 [Corynebacterium sp. P5848]|uniref:hypothetical protein n=1 Tax=Corynebacterium marambiense TaxID=2765364 RepID=UPI002260DED0|nr:hypothetical protein [Corynebacterium marambiense]MCX7542987.1 hypothetical protein [Corynebacterium marambiense]